MSSILPSRGDIGMLTDRMAMDPFAAASTTPIHQAQVESTDQASQTDMRLIPRQAEHSIQTETGPSHGEQPDTVADDDISDVPSSSEGELTEERDRDDAQTVFDIVDTGVRTPQVDMDEEMEEISRGWGIDRPIRPLPGPSSGNRIRPFAIPSTGPKTKQDKKREKRERQNRRTKISGISNYRAGAHIRFEEQFEQVLRRVDGMSLQLYWRTELISQIIYLWPTGKRDGPTCPPRTILIHLDTASRQVATDPPPGQSRPSSLFDLSSGPPMQPSTSLISSKPLHPLENRERTETFI